MNRYKNIGIIRNSEGKLYRKNTIFPILEPSFDDIYVITTAGDRYDTIALDYYNDSSLWWVIASANRHTKASLVIQPGIQLRIPADVEGIIEEYETLNARR